MAATGQGRLPLGYDEWLRLVLDRPGEPCTWDDDAPWTEMERTNVWYAHDAGALIDRWAEFVGPERITVIISDGNPDLLPRTFERLLGVPHGMLARHPGESNVSLPWGRSSSFARSTRR